MIDVHHHFEPSGRNVDGTPWSITAAVDELDRNGIATAIAYAGPVFEEGTKGAEDARAMNEWATALCRAHPGRFGLFASIPMNDADRALGEITYALDVLHADGIGISTHYGEQGLGEARFQPIFEELDRRGAVVYVHPAGAPCESPVTPVYENPLISAPWIEFPANTARTMLSLWSTQTTRRLRSVKFIFCHGGGVMPILLGRIAGFQNWANVGEAKLHELFPDGIYAEYAKFYLDCAQAYAPETFALLRSIVPATRLLYGSDYSYFPIAHSVEQFMRLDLPDADRHLVRGGNASTLFSRFAPPAEAP